MNGIGPYHPACADLGRREQFVFVFLFLFLFSIYLLAAELTADALIFQLMLIIPFELKKKSL